MTDVVHPPEATGGWLDVFERDVLLTTGRSVRIRPARPGDVKGLGQFYATLSVESRSSRFFGFRPAIPERELVATTVQDPAHHVALVALEASEIIGAADYYEVGDDEAEIAVAVADRYHHEGVGTLLVEDLASIARASGFRRLVAQTLPSNTKMRSVFANVGLLCRQWFDDGVVEVQLDLTDEHLLQDDADLRDWKATVASLRPIVSPTHVVVIGASRRDGPGRRILGHLEETFTGRISVVHPTAASVGLTPAVRSLAELDSVPELAIVAVPAPHVQAVIEECGAAGIAAAVVIASGFAETGPLGARLETEVLASARRHGMRIVGPNCLGVVATGVGLNATFATQQFRAGGIAIGAQSGGVGIAIAAEAEHRRAGISAFVSMGNKADVSGNDLLRLWADDDRTSVILLYLESFGNAQRFARVARAVSRRKPVVALFGGRSVAGSRGTRSHTAALATDDAAVDALFEHTGVIRANGLEELMDTGILLDSQPAPAGTRTVLVGNAGGPLVLAADAADQAGLDLPELSPELQGRIRSIVPDAAATANPVDLSAQATPEQVAAVVDAVASSGEADTCVAVIVEIDDVTAMIVDALGRVAGDITLALAYLGGEPGESRVPAFPSPERVMRAVSLATRRATWLRVAADDDVTGAPGPDDATTFAAARRTVRGALDGRDDSTANTWLAPGTAFDVLASVGVPVAPWRIAMSPGESAAAFRQLGGECVIKAIVDDLVHKSDEGAVVVGIESPEQARSTHRALARRFGSRFRGAIVQSRARPGVELLVGAIRDPQFGPLVVVAAGGVNAEVLDDRAVLIAPVTIAGATRAIERLRIAPLLHGYRNRPPVPVPKIAELVARIGRLVAVVPEIDQLDLNPVIVDSFGCVAVDARVAVKHVSSPATPLRGLRPGRGASAP